jgi:hypothetical protein
MHAACAMGEYATWKGPAQKLKTQDLSVADNVDLTYKNSRGRVRIQGRNRRHFHRAAR